MSVVSFDVSSAPDAYQAFSLGSPPGLGTPFWVNNSIWNGTATEDSGDLWHVPLGAAAGAAVQITAETPAVYGTGASFFEYPIASPDRSKILSQHSDDGSEDRWLYVMNPDGSGRVAVRSSSTEDPLWLGNDAIAFLGTTGLTVTDVVRIDIDGTGETSVVSKDSVHGFHPSPDGAKIAYTANDGADKIIAVVDADGTNDTTLATGIASSPGQPVWLLDGSAILFRNGTGGWDTIEPDGTNQTTILATAPNGFWYECGMAEDRFFYTDTSTFSNWRLASIDLAGGGATILSPNRRLSQAVQRGVCVYDPDQGRVFSVLHRLATGSTGVDAIFSVLPDGSDFRIHFEAEEEDWSDPGENFQNLGFR